MLSKLEYLANSKDNEDVNFVARFDIDPTKVKNLKEQLTNSPDIRMRKVLEGINDGRTLLSKFNHMGVESFTPKELRRYILEEEKKRVTAQKEKEKLEEEAENFRNSQAGQAVEALSNK